MIPGLVRRVLNTKKIPRFSWLRAGHGCLDSDCEGFVDDDCSGHRNQGVTLTMPSGSKSLQPCTGLLQDGYDISQENNSIAEMIMFSTGMTFKHADSWTRLNRR
jgi:hypothetical protein